MKSFNEKIVELSRLRHKKASLEAAKKGYNELLKEELSEAQEADVYRKLGKIARDEGSQEEISR